jgi:hypothetical protein
MQRWQNMSKYGKVGISVFWGPLAIMSGNVETVILGVFEVFEGF